MIVDLLTLRLKYEIRIKSSAYFMAMDCGVNYPRAQE